jgi:hypothetical protein
MFRKVGRRAGALLALTVALRLVLTTAVAGAASDPGTTK